MDRRRIFALMLSCAVSGTVFAAAAVILLEPAAKERFAYSLSGYLGALINSGGVYGIPVYDVMLESFVKHGKYVLFIWFLAFVSHGAVFVYAVLFIKGLGIGFASVMTLYAFGKSGFGYAAALYLPQNLILVPAYIFVGYASLCFSISPSKSPLKRNPTVEYFVALMIGLVCVFLACLTETYIIPYFIRIFL